jgi:DNA ligase-1
VPTDSVPSPATLLEFARASDAAAATTKKLQKQAILAEYFRRLSDDEDLRLAVRYFSGRAFAGTDERVLGASGAIVSDVVLALLKLDGREYHDLVVRAGEIGEAISKVWSRLTQTASAAAPPRDASALTLQEISRAFDDLASTGNQERKREILRGLYWRCVDGREAAYLSKIIFSEPRTGVREGVLHYAIAEAFGRDGAAVNRAQLLLGDLGEVAVLAKHDRLAEARFTLFHPIQFMLATPQETAADAAETIGGRTFFAEDKLDGIRAQVHKSADGTSGDRIAIYTRTMDRTDESFPDVVAAIRKIPGEFLLDGEIVPWRDGVVLPFAHVQRRLGRKTLTPKMLRDNPAAFIAFDILYLNGELLMDRPLRERRAALARLSSRGELVEEGKLLEEFKRTPPPHLRGGGGGEGRVASDLQSAPAGDRKPLTPPPNPLPASGEGEQRTTAQLLITAISEVSTAEQIDAAFCKARDCRNEGLVLKDPESAYSPGRRGQWWLKLKTHLPTLDCVVTAAEYGHGKRRNVLSDYTFAVWDKDPATEPDAQLVNVGKAYSGVTDEEIAQLTELFLKLAREQHYGRVFLVEPKIVLEIACDQIQKSARHNSGYALRFPRIKRIRWDKGPEDADQLARVAELYESTANTARGGQIIEPPKSDSQPTLFEM